MPDDCETADGRRNDTGDGSLCWCRKSNFGENIATQRTVPCVFIFPVSLAVRGENEKNTTRRCIFANPTGYEYASACSVLVVAAADGRWPPLLRHMPAGAYHAVGATTGRPRRRDDDIYRRQIPTHRARRDRRLTHPMHAPHARASSARPYKGIGQQVRRTCFSGRGSKSR